MSRARSLLALDSLPQNADVGLLALRVWLGLSLLSLHGWGKLTRLLAGETAFVSVLGLNETTSLVLATLVEVGAAALLVVGAATRWAALSITITLGIAFVVAHGAQLTGEGNGELAFIYVAGAVAILIAGPGRYSLDERRGRSRASDATSSVPTHSPTSHSG